MEYEICALCGLRVKLFHVVFHGQVMDRIISPYLSESVRHIANRNLYKRQRRPAVGTRRVYGGSVETGQNETKYSFELRAKFLFLPEDGSNQTCRN